MARFGIISDIHSNDEALFGVLEELGASGVDGIICLGDVVGYGPSPERCLQMTLNYSDIIVRGNHDEAVIDPDAAVAFNPAAQEAISWTRAQLGPGHLIALTQMKSKVVLGDVCCVHDTPEFGAGTYLVDRRAAAHAFTHQTDRVCLIGHTHVPKIFEAPLDETGSFVDPDDIVVHTPRAGEAIELRPDRRYLCNPGSVGQPRDCDPRASYAILDTETWTFAVQRREYDIAAVQQATELAGLPPVLADRLAIGA